MPDAWKMLMDLGLPDGAARPPPRRGFDPDAVRAAVRELVRSPSLPRTKVAPLLAWLRAWRHHWPTRFADVLGDESRAFLAELQGQLDDENRYLKLRRIAIANLSHIL
ncbi:MAG: hypothetical protein ACYTG3_11305 [Planctomycetota bacterium]